MIEIFLTLINLAFITFLLKNISKRARLRITFENYLYSLKEINKVKSSINEYELILNSISKNGIKLLIKILFYIIPFIISYLILIKLYESINTIIILSSIPYLICLTNIKK